jgi:hypothetical protein
MSTPCVRLTSYHVLKVAIVLVADVFDHFRVDHDALVHPDGPRPRVRLVTVVVNWTAGLKK